MHVYGVNRVEVFPGGQSAMRRFDMSRDYNGC